MSELSAEAIPERIVTLRKKRGMSQMDLARASGVWTSQISRFETGESKPSVDSLINLASALDCTADDLLRIP